MSYSLLLPTHPFYRYHLPSVVFRRLPPTPGPDRSSVRHRFLVDFRDLFWSMSLFLLPLGFWFVESLLLLLSFFESLKSDVLVQGLLLLDFSSSQRSGLVNVTSSSTSSSTSVGSVSDSNSSAWTGWNMRSSD